MPRVVLFEPEIPPNTGNVARTCAATETELHLVEPLGFEISDRTLKRAGLDYWPFVQLRRHSNWAQIYEQQQLQGAQACRRKFCRVDAMALQQRAQCLAVFQVGGGDLRVVLGDRLGYAQSGERLSQVH